MGVRFINLIPICLTYKSTTSDWQRSIPDVRRSSQTVLAGSGAGLAGLILIDFRYKTG
jgi:hypothetical protein